MNEKITPEHRDKTAYVYVRQSSMQQVRNHLEGQQRQYAMSQRAREMGFRSVIVIDDDLGRSGSGSQERPGFARLLAAVCEGTAGAVLALEASRLARNNRDWHHLIDLCGMTKTLVIDEGGTYDPRLLNDRLLLGLKGTMSELELELLRQRAQEARTQMILRGDVIWEVPVGLIRTPENGVELIPDRQVQHAIRGVFRKFRELGSARQVLLWYQQEKVPLPQARPATGGEEVEWRLPVYGRILKVLKNPFYAGAFAYGRSSTSTVIEDGRARKTYQRAVPLEDWEVLILDHHPGYIGWDEYLRNRKTLESNTSMRGNGNSGASKRGPALLAGLLRCARCGRMLHVKYCGKNGREQRYHCCGAQINHGKTKCISVGGVRLDRVVAINVLDALQPAGIEASLQAVEQLRRKDGEKKQSLELALEKARYESERARRQYDSVEPENRLVAAELEARWNESIKRVHDLESRLQEAEASEPELTEDHRRRLIELGEDLQTAWNHPAAPDSLKKRILRTVLEEIVIDLSEKPPEILLRLHWKGGAHTQLRTLKNRTGQHQRSTDREAVELVRELAKVCKDRDIASILNRLGYRTGAGNHWKESRVRTLRSYQKIPVFDQNSRSWVTLTEAAAELRVSPTVVRRLIKDDTLPARQVVAYAPWIIERQDLDLPDVKRVVQAVHDGRETPRTHPEQLELPLG